jgi:hypothetical protein
MSQTPSSPDSEDNAAAAENGNETTGSQAESMAAAAPEGGSKAPAAVDSEGAAVTPRENKIVRVLEGQSKTEAVPEGEGGVTGPPEGGGGSSGSSGGEGTAAVAESPETEKAALDAAYANAMDRAMKHYEIAAQVEHLNVQHDLLKDALREVENEMFAVVIDETAQVHKLYSEKSRLIKRSVAQAQRQPARIRPKPVESRRESSRQKLESTSEWKTLLEDIKDAIEWLEVALATQALVPYLRLWLNVHREQQAEQDWLYKRPLDDVDTRELRSPVTGESFLETERLGELGRLLARMPGGSVGIAGPRGSGKSTAIANIEQILASSQDDPDHRYRVFQVVVSAPVEYVPREFLLYLHEKICDGWLAFNNVDTLPDQPSANTKRSRAAWNAATIVLPLVLGIIAAGLIRNYVKSADIDRIYGAAPLVVASVVVALSAVLGFWLADALRFSLNYSYRGQSIRVTDALAPWEMATEFSPAGTLRFVWSTILLSLAASTLIVVYASGWLGWLDLRRLSGLLLLAAALVGAVLTWSLATADLPSSRRLPSILLGTSVGVAVGSAGLHGIGLLFSADLYRPTAPLIVGGALAASAASLFALWDARPPVQLRNDEASGSIGMAHQDRRRLRYLRTQGSQFSSSAKIGASSYIPLEFQSASTISSSDVEVPLTTPNVTQMLRNLLGQIRQENPDESFRIVIGIDELDKLEGVEGAKNFLNEIKSVFGIPGVLFLVSVSEDAMASFERRGLGFRDVFDSAFDEIFNIPQLLLSETRKLIGKRISNVPRPFAALAHCLSAGLARDVIRSVDNMTDTVSPKTMQRVTEAAVHREIRGKWQAVVAAIRPIPIEPQTTDLLKALYPIDLCATAESNEELCLMRADAFKTLETLVLEFPEQSELIHLRILQRLGGEYVGFTYFCRTLIDFFNLEPHGQIDRFVGAEKADRLARTSIDYLARARQHLGVNPRLAWEQISFFREAHDMSAVDFPKAMLGSPGTPSVLVHKKAGKSVKVP